MKRLLLVFLAITFVFMLTGCTNEKELYCYDDVFSIEMKYDDERLLSVTSVEYGVENTFSETDLQESTDLLFGMYEGDNFHEVMLGFIDNAESAGATCELKNR